MHAGARTCHGMWRLLVLLCAAGAGAHVLDAGNVTLTAADSRITLPSAVYASGSYSMEAWVYVVSQGIMFTFTTTTGYGFKLSMSGGVLYFRRSSSSTGTTCSITPSFGIPTNTWTHVAYSHTPGVSSVVYINGTALYTDSAPATNCDVTTVSKNNVIFGDFDYNQAARFRFTELKVWDINISASQIGRT